MRVWVAASQAGAANALTPVLRRLQARWEVHLCVLAEGQALPILQERGIPVQEVPQERGRRAAFLCALFQEQPPDTLLLGTSRGPSIEKELIRIAQERGVPALSVVDHWSNYRERFTEPDSRRLRLPNRIALPDEHALKQAVAEGLPCEILRVTGQPHLQALAMGLREPSLQRRAAELRTAWLAAGEGPVLLFCSEWFSDSRGYTQTEALEEVVEALDLLDAAHRIRPKLVVRPHPKESADWFQGGVRAIRRGFRMESSAPPWACVLAADLLVGMTSMLLLEGTIAGRPAISYQPAQGRAVPFVGSQMGIVPAARSPQELSVLLSEGFLSRRWAVDSGFLRGILCGDAAASIEELLLELRG